MSDDINQLIARPYAPPPVAQQMTTAAQGASAIIGAQSNQLALQQAQLQPAYSALGAVVAKGSAATSDDITRAFAAAQRAGGNTEGLQAEMTARLTGSDNMPKESPAEIAKTMWLRSQAPFEQAQLALPQRTAQNVGGQMVYGTLAPALSGTGAFTPAGGQPVGALPLGQTPGELGAKTTWVDSQGQEHQGTLQQYQQAAGYDPGARITSGGGAGGGAPAAGGGGLPSDVTTGRQPITPVSAPGGTTPPGGATTAGGATTTTTTAPPAGPIVGPPPVLPGLLKQGAQDYLDAQATDRTLSQRISPLQQAMSTLNTNKDVVVGPNAQEYNDINAMLQSAPVKSVLTSLGIKVPDEATTAGGFEVAKDLRRYAQTLPGAGATDFSRIDAALANPSAGMPRAAIMDLVAKTIGLERMRSAAYRAFNAKHGGAVAAMPYAGNYGAESADFMRDQDPVGYAADLMPKADRDAYAKGLRNPRMQQNYQNSYNNAYQHFGVQVPD